MTTRITKAMLGEELRMERLLRVATCLVESGYCAQVGQLAATARAFRADKQLWAAHARYRSPTGTTLLMHAAWTGNVGRIVFLLERGAEVEAASAKFGDTALTFACAAGHCEAARALVERGGANVNAASTTDGQTALMLASWKGHLEIVRWLVERGGTSVDAASTIDGQTALMWASWNGHLEIVRCLVEHGGANVNAARTDYGHTALMLASGKGHLRIVRLLLQHGADRHALTHYGHTAHTIATGHSFVQAALV